MRRSWILGIFGGVVILLFAAGHSAALTGQVTMPFEELKRMQDELKSLKQNLLDALARTEPASASISTARYSATVDANGLDVAATLHVSAKGKGSVEIPLFDNRAIIVDAVLPPSAGLITRDGKAFLKVSAPGDLEIRLRLALAGEKNAVTFGIPRTGASSIQVTIPGTEGAARITPSGGERTRIEAGRTIIEAAIPPVDEITIGWSAVEAGTVSSGVGATGRLYLQTASVVTVEQEILRGRTLLRYDIRGGVARGFTIALADSMTIVEVRGDAVAGWEKISAGTQPAIEIHPAGNVTARTDIIVDWELPIGASENVEIPRLCGLGVEREAGSIAVAAGDGVEVEPGIPDQMTPVDPKDASAELTALSSRPLVQVARYVGEVGHLAVSVKRPEAVAVVAARIENISGHTVAFTSGRTVTHLKADLRNSTVEYLDVELPAGARLLNAAVAGKIVVPLRGEKPNAVRLPLVRSDAAEEGGTLGTVEIMYSEDGANPRLFGSATMHSPTFSLDIGHLRWLVSLPSGSHRIASDWSEWTKTKVSEGPTTEGKLLGFEGNEVPSIAYERTALDANAVASPVSIYFATEACGRWINLLVFLLSTVTIIFGMNGDRRSTATGLVALVIVIYAQWAFGGAVIKLFEGCLAGVLIAGAKWFLKREAVVEDASV